MAMVQIAYKARSDFHYASVLSTNWIRRAKTPLFQAFLRPSCLKKMGIVSKALLR